MKSLSNHPLCTRFINNIAQTKFAQQEGRGVSQIQLTVVPSFDPLGDPNTILLRWNKSKKFIYYIEVSGITNDVQKRNALLYLVGIETQEIFET